MLKMEVSKENNKELNGNLSECICSDDDNYSFEG